MSKAEPIVLIRFQEETAAEKANQILNKFLGQKSKHPPRKPLPLLHS